MKKLAAALCVLFLMSCNDTPKGPDVSGIEVSLQVHRFDKDFFSIDSIRSQEGLEQLGKKYPGFAPLFVANILGLGSMEAQDQLVTTGTRRFLHLNQSLYDTVQQVFPNTRQLEQDLATALRHLRYYFPDYPLPQHVYTVIGPMDALPPLSNGEPSPNFMGDGFVAIGLQFYLGHGFSIYNDPNYAAAIVPQFRSRRFNKEYIVADVMKLLLDDLYADSSSRLPLGERFVEKGKRLYVLQQLLPGTADTILTGYTKAQLNWCMDNERSILNFFSQQNLLYERDPGLTQPFLNDAPFTQGMPQESPGNIGAFLGWQMVKAYMKKNKEVSLPSLLRTSAKTIIETSGYKPR